MTLTPADAHVRDYAEQLLLRHGLYGWEVVFDRATKRAGQCDHRNLTLSFSRPLIRARGVEATLETVRHEVAHALVGAGHGHDATWKRQFIALGGEGKRCYDDSMVDADKMGTRYVGTCPNGHKSYYSRKVVRDRSCPKCNPRRYDERYKITIVDTQTGRVAEKAAPRQRRATRKPFGSYWA